MGRNLTNLFISQSYEFLTQISGSELQDGLGNDITFLAITASQANNATSASFASTSVSSSFAQNATSASFAQTASFALNVPTIDSGSFLITASISNANITFTKGDASTFGITVNNVSNANSASLAANATNAVSSSHALFADNAGAASTATSASHALNADNAISASFAQTASFALNVTPMDTGSFVTTASISDATITFTKGNASTFNITVDNVSNADSASVAVSASHALNANNAISASFATNATSASFANSTLFATSASHAINADTASFLPSTTNLNITSITASGANFTNLIATSASIGFLQTITGSATIIGDAFIILNTNNAQRYAGIIVEDSGSNTPVNYTASLQFDSLNNDWFYEYTSSGDPDNFGVVLFGPEYNTIGVPTYPTNNKLVKGDGGHHLNDSNISDDGSTVSISTPLVVTGSINATSFTGSLQGNASTATSASHALNADNAISSSFATNASQATSSSFATSASFASTATSASFATNSTSASFASTSISSSFATSASFATTASFALNATPGFPFTGSAQITGSLGVTGSITRTSGSFSGSVIDNITDTFATPKVEHVVTLTQTEYNSLTPDADTLYIISGSTPINFSGFATTGSNTFIGNQIVTGSVSATLGFTGSLSGTASFANNATSASFAETASFFSLASVTQNAVFSGSVRGEVRALSISSNTASLDCSTDNFFTLLLVSGSNTFVNPSNIQPGQTINLRVKQASVTSGSISFAPSVKQVSGSIYTASTTASREDIVTFISFDSSSLYLSNIKNFV
jgi:hypothetical protein